MDIKQLKELSDIDLLATLIRGEAEGEPLLGKIAVACVVRNRVEDPQWPDAWSGVMLQKYQFSCFFACLFPAGNFGTSRNYSSKGMRICRLWRFKWPCAGRNEWG